MPINLLGQDSLKNYVNSLSLENCPHSILLCGAKGSGKHTFCQYLCDTTGMLYIDVKASIGNDKLSTKGYSASDLRDYLDYCYTCVDIRCLIIDYSDIDVKDSSVLLKFLEEPPKNVFIVILTEYPDYVLDTIKNRCRVLCMEPYTNEQLGEFCTCADELDVVLKYATAPGQVIELCRVGLQAVRSVEALCKNIFTQIQNASYSNILNIPETFFSTSNQNFPFVVFLRILTTTIFDMINQSQIPFSYYDAALLTFKFIDNCRNPRIDKRVELEHYLFDLKQILRGAST